MNLSRWIWCSILAACAGCQGIDVPSFSMPPWKLNSPFNKLRAQNSDEEDDEFETRTETPLIGEYIRVTGLNLITIRGVGLVTGLNGTGGDPPPSRYRQQMIEEMQRRNVKNYHAILRSPNTALVVVQAYVPPLVRKRDRFDVEVRLPEGSEGTSLRGGWLMETYLKEQAYIPGRGMLPGNVLAKAEGPILISNGGESTNILSGTEGRGRVLGGGISRIDRDLMLYLRNDFGSYRTAKLIADQIGKRFHLYNRYGIREPAAEAKTDQKTVLKVLPKYKDNFPRYLQVVRNIPRRETIVARRMRMGVLKEQLNHPPTAEQAALKLEAIGLEAIPVLKTGLKNKSLEVRFHAAVALAYLGEADGVKTLSEAAQNEPAFRVFAFAALSSLDDVDAVIALRILMSEKSSETRYGAFRALSTMDENDPFLNREEVDKYFNLHVLNTSGEPMVHITNRKKGELVLFGSEQKFKSPLWLRAGNDIQIHAQPGSDTITVSRFAVGEEDQRETVSTRIADVVHTAVKFGASYPDIVEMFLQADRQHKLPGQFAIDALPQAGRTYYRHEGNASNLASRQNVRIGNSGHQPTLFTAGGRITEQVTAREG
ncbi:MAG: flagellar basal body P-ring protein FlgI, partial [Planctomycetes bacterium]|nr:flagellar basal body P-ring protein FlgI [Planctomycetota bacterium]